MAPAVSGQGPVPPVVFGSSAVLFRPPGDPAPGYVIGGHLDRHFIAGQDADEVHAQLAGDVGQNNMAVSDVHMERGVGQGFRDDSLQLDHIIFRQA